MSSKVLRDRIGLLFICAALYLLIDIPFRATGISLFTGYTGPKNFVPATMGILFGCFGAIGTCIGAAISGLLTGAHFDSILFECIYAVLMGCGSWLLWYCGRNAHPIKLKRWSDLGRFMACIVSLSALCATISFALEGGAIYVSVFLSFVIWNALLSVPVIILMTSIMGILPVCPPWCPNDADLESRLPAEMQSIQSINDELDKLCFEKRLDRRKCFQIQNCIEELLLRVFSDKAWGELHLRIYISDSVSVYIEYAGLSYNPLNASREESWEDLMGLLLIKQRALRASYHYRDGVNGLHIVL